MVAKLLLASWYDAAERKYEHPVAFLSFPLPDSC